MDQLVARAFLCIRLSPEQRAKLRAYERSGTLPAGRYLTGFEVCRMFRLEPEPISELDLTTMAELLDRFNRTVLWKQRQIEEKNHETACQGIPANLPCRCRSKVQEVHEWEDYAFVHFGLGSARGAA